MRTRCANCGMIYEIIATDMDMRSHMEVMQSGVCPRCNSNAHNQIFPEASYNREEEK